MSYLMEKLTLGILFDLSKTLYSKSHSCILSACQTTTSNMGNNNKTHNINIGGVLYTRDVN